ncbi:MAG: hypothetical protein IPL46_17930 [Saprospiraceae bacterium]|nr:hypothetical protein [Saprospiraceae bacterium]
MKNNFWSTLSAFFFTTFCMAQNPVPNASFEGWTGLEPDHWHTSNSPGGNNTNVTRVEQGYSGDFAIKGEVIVWPNTPGFLLSLCWKAIPGSWLSSQSIVFGTFIVLQIPPSRFQRCVDNFR